MKRVVAAAVVSAVVFGCAAPGPLPIPADDPRPEALLRGLFAAAREREALRGEARFALDSPDLRFRRPQRMVIGRPARLRVEVLALFGQIAGVLACDGREYQFLDLSTRQMERGPVEPGLLWQFARIDLRAEEAVDLLLAAPAPEPGLARGRARAWEDGRVVIAFVDSEGHPRQYFEFDVRGDLLAVEALGGDGEPTWQVAYADYRAVASDRFPFEVEMRFPQVDAEARFDFSRVELNPELGEGLFRLEPLLD